MRNCECGHHRNVHFGESTLCVSPEICGCRKFREAAPEPEAKRYAAMTGAELYAQIRAMEGAFTLDFTPLTALRDAIRAEAGAVAWKHILPYPETFTDGRDWQLLETQELADEELRVCGGTIIPLYAAPVPNGVTDHTARLISDAEVVAELIERGIQPSHETIRDIAYLLRALTAALRPTRTPEAPND